MERHIDIMPSQTSCHQACKALQHRRPDVSTDERPQITALLASLSLLAALQLWECTPLAWAAAWLPGYHLLRTALHLLIAQERSQVCLSWNAVSP